MNEIYEKTQEIFRSALGSESEITPDVLLKRDVVGDDVEASDLGLSSLQVIEILIEVESYFNIDIGEEAIVKLRTFHDLVKQIEVLVQKQEEETMHLEALKHEIF